MFASLTRSTPLEIDLKTGLCPGKMIKLTKIEQWIQLYKDLITGVTHRNIISFQPYNYQD